MQKNCAQYSVLNLFYIGIAKEVVEYIKKNRKIRAQMKFLPLFLTFHPKNFPFDIA